MLELINSARRTYNSRRVHTRLIKADFTTDQSITPLEGRPSLINLHQLLKESGVETYRSFITVRGRLINLPFLGTMITRWRLANGTSEISKYRPRRGWDQGVF